MVPHDDRLAVQAGAGSPEALIPAGAPGLSSDVAVRPAGCAMGGMKERRQSRTREIGIPRKVPSDSSSEPDKSWDAAVAVSLRPPWHRRLRRQGRELSAI
jgi:hypothetical protein